MGELIVVDIRVRCISFASVTCINLLTGAEIIKQYLCEHRERERCETKYLTIPSSNHPLIRTIPGLSTHLLWLLLALVFHIEALAIMLCMNEYYSNIQTKPVDGT